MALKFSTLFFIFLFSIAEVSLADQMSYLIRMPRITAMGGAGIGLADDEYALFQNPAGLAGIETRKFKVLGLGVEGSSDSYSSLGDSVNAVNNFTLSSLNKLMGKDIYVRGSNATLFQLPHFELAYIVDAQGSINQFNQSNPTFRIGDQITHGVQTGIGWKLKGGKKSRDEFRFGLAGKLLWRRGGYYDVATAGFLSATNNGKQYINNLVGGYGIGMGVDTGIQYVNHIDKRTSVMMGASVTDIGDTKFSDTHASKIPMNIGFGLGFTKDLNFFKIKMAADLKNINQSIGFSNKTHLGTEISMPLFDFHLGLNQMNMTYGFAMDLWVTRLSILSYAEELGINYHQNYSRRYMVQVDFNLPI